MGLIFLAFGLGGLIGPPFGGWLADASDGSTIPIGFAVVTSVTALVLSLTMPTGAVAVGEPAVE
jgi:predicted MFS family arabinose efflux permease